MSDRDLPPYTYTSAKPPLAETSEQLRARIPGWGVDLDPADRPSFPQERFDPSATGAHWDLPEPQPERWPRERSIEHAGLTPVFGTAQPPKGLSGAIRKLAYRRWSEARAAHWLVLIAADRVDVYESFVGSLVRGKPDSLLAETGVKTELSHHGVSSRRGRVDVRHQVLDPVVFAAPWVAGSYVCFRAGKRLLRAL